MSYSFGDANNLKNLDFSKLKANLTKEDLGIEENSFEASIFNSIDTDGNKKLDRRELSVFAQIIKELAGDDNHISNEEAGNYSVDGQNIGEMQNSYTDNRINSAGERLHSKVVEFFRFINSLVEQTEGVESVKNKRKKSIIKYENGTTEIRYDDGNIIVKDANGKVIIDTKKSIEPEKGSPVTDEQYYMINYLKEQLTNAKAVMEQIEIYSKDSSFAAGLTNWWYDMTGKEFSRENLENLISNLEENVGLLEEAANKSPEEFARVCQEKLGINFDAQKVEDFMIQAQEFSLLQQQMSILAKARMPRNYIGGHGHAAADAVASYREMTELFISICTSMGYKEEDIAGIIREAAVEYNDGKQKYDLTNISFDQLTNPNNLYIIATREGGGSDVAPSEFYDLLFKKLSSRIESDMITLYDIGGEGTSTDKVNRFYESKKESYNGNLSAVLGTSNVEDLANTYDEKLQSGIANVNGFFTAVTVVATFASGGVGLLANVAKGTSLVSKSARALSLCDKAIRVTNGANRFISVAGMVAAANPTTFFDQLFSENGMTTDAFCAWGKGVLQNAAFMASGMLASRQAANLANCYKSKALVNLFKNGEQSFDDLMNAIKSRPQNFPPNLVKNLNSISRASTMLQVSAETILDTIYTVSLGVSMQGDDYEFTGEDFLMSLAFAINGGVLQKELAPISDQAKARYIQDALKDFELSNDDALKIVDYLKRIDEGELTLSQGKLKQERALDEVNIIAKAEDNVAGINYGERTTVEPTAVRPPTSFENFCNSIRNSDAKAEIFKAEDGRIIARVRTSSQMGRAKYECYIFNKEGEIIGFAENVKKSEFESNYSEFRETGVVRNTSGTLNSGFNFFGLFSKPKADLGWLKEMYAGQNGQKQLVPNTPQKVNYDTRIRLANHVDINLRDLEPKLNAMQDGDSFIIGRAVTGVNDIQINNSHVSGAHIKIEKRNGEIYITDMGSSNGTILNTVKPDNVAKWAPDIQNKYQNANSTDFNRLCDKYYDELRIANYTKEESISSNVKQSDIMPEDYVIQNDNIVGVPQGSWFWRTPKRVKRSGLNIVDRVSLNVKADKNLLRELDQLMQTGEYTNKNGQKVRIDVPAGYYKTPQTLEKWCDRHDPITMYFSEKISPELTNAIAEITEKYARKPNNGRELMNSLPEKPWIAHEEYIPVAKAQELYRTAERLNPELARGIASWVDANGSWNCSTGMYAAAERMVNEYILSLGHTSNPNSFQSSRIRNREYSAPVNEARVEHNSVSMDINPSKAEAYSKIDFDLYPSRMPERGEYLNQSAQYVINPNALPTLQLRDGTVIDFNSALIKGKILNLQEGEFITLGRGEEADINVSSDTSISRQHLIITKLNGHLILKDISKYGNTRCYIM